MPETTLTEELIVLRELKNRSAALTKEAKTLAAEYKREESRLLTRMEAEKTDGVKADGTSFSRITGEGKESGVVQDRKAFVAWALENDEELVEYKERGEQLNAFVRRLLDDGAEFPPGLAFRSTPYVSMRTA